MFVSLHLGIRRESNFMWGGRAGSEFCCLEIFFYTSTDCIFFVWQCLTPAKKQTKQDIIITIF